MESWIKVEKTSGIGNDEVSITLKPNESNKIRAEIVIDENGIKEI